MSLNCCCVRDTYLNKDTSSCLLFCLPADTFSVSLLTLIHTLWYHSCKFPLQASSLFLPRSSPLPAAGCAPLWCLYKSSGTQWPVWSDPACGPGPWLAGLLLGSNHCHRKLPARQHQKGLNTNTHLEHLVTKQTEIQYTDNNRSSIMFHRITDPL